MASKEEIDIHEIWMTGYNLLFKARHHGMKDLPHHFIAFRERGLDDETIAAALEVPVEDVNHDIEIYTEAISLMRQSDKLAAKWITENGRSPLLEGYDE